MVKNKKLIRELVDSLEKKDIDKTLLFFTDDAIWVTPEDTFKGKEQIKKYVTWMANILNDLKCRDEGVGILAQEEKAVHQYVLCATFKGIEINVDCVCTFEFSANKIKKQWTVMDRLSIAKQAATGPIARKIVNSIIAKSEEGLH